MQDARGRGYIKINVSSDIGNNLSVLGNQNHFQILQKPFMDFVMSELIYRYGKLFSNSSQTPFTDMASL